MFLFYGARLLLFFRSKVAARLSRRTKTHVLLKVISLVFSLLPCSITHTSIGGCNCLCMLCCFHLTWYSRFHNHRIFPRGHINHIRVSRRRRVNSRSRHSITFCHFQTPSRSIHHCTFSRAHRSNLTGETNQLPIYSRRLCRVCRTHRSDQY